MTSEIPIQETPPRTVRVEQPVPGHGHDVRRQAGRVDHLRPDLLQAPRPDQAHVHLELVVQNAERVVDALEPVRRERVQERAADAHRGRAQGDGLEDVVRAADAPVHK